MQEGFPVFGNDTRIQQLAIEDLTDCIHNMEANLHKFIKYEMIRYSPDSEEFDLAVWHMQGGMWELAWLIEARYWIARSRQ